MVGRPGRLQSSFSAGELDPLMHERSELKYFGSGAALMENVEIIPQGGFRVRDGLRDVGGMAVNAERLFPFDASNGASYDLVFRPGAFEAWGEPGFLANVNIAGLTAAMLPTMTAAQQLDTMLIFHRALQSKRIRHSGPTSWVVDNLPWDTLPNYDYGGSYSNGVAARWRLEFIGLNNGDLFVVTVNNQDTAAVSYSSSTGSMADAIRSAILDLPNVQPGLGTTADGARVEINFSGSGNAGDGWAVSARVVSRADAAILSAKTRVGIRSGEPVVSATRGWPQCGVFYNQRLLVGGWSSLPNAWLFSTQGSYFNFDERLNEANGSALVPMDLPGGEAIERIVGGRNLMIFTSGGEYWLAERAISKTTPPNHVQSSTNGIAAGVPVAQNEGAALFVHASGSVLGEFRYTDVEGNYVALNISVLGSHLLRSVKDMALRKSRLSVDGNQLGIVMSDGFARTVTLLREQEVTGFSRVTSPEASFKAVSVNGRNEMSWLVDRPGGRRLERFEDGLLLDEALTQTFSSASMVVAGLERFNGRTVWCVADQDVFGPFVVAGGFITLPVAVMVATVGSWTPPKVTTLPLPRDVGPNIVLKRKARIHSVQLSLVDTTSVAVAVNDGAAFPIDLRRWGMEANVPELAQGFTGTVPIRGLTGFVDEPKITITQVRPGRLTVRSVTLEAQL